jgi:ribosome maturation factor RimP
MLGKYILAGSSDPYLKFRCIFAALSKRKGTRKVPFFVGTAMGRISEILRKLAEEAVEGTDMFVVGVHPNSTETLIRIHIDADSGLNMKRLGEVSRAISRRVDELDTGEQQFTMEVSSPGAEKPLTMLRQLPKHLGRKLDILKVDGERLIAVFKALEAETLELEIPSEKKGRPGTPAVLAWSDIKELRVHIGK